MITRRSFIQLTGAGAVALGLGAHSVTSAAAGSGAGDLGPQPAVIDLTRLTVRNDTYRTALWSCDDLQLTLMSIPVGGDIGLEMHDDVDQFLRIEAGQALVTMGSATMLDKVWAAGPGDAICIPAGTWHNVVNTGSSPLKLYSLYGPQQHPLGTVHLTKPDEGPAPTIPVGAPQPVRPFTHDVGATAYVFDVEQATLDNTNFRMSAFTAPRLQLTLMSIPVGGDVGLEMHDHVDQFLRVEEGMARVYFGESESSVRFDAIARPGDAILVPSGTWHNIVNLSPRTPLKLYSIYGPQQHPLGTIHVTKPEHD